jgi:S-adenosylmethionine hydrolase
MHFKTWHCYATRPSFYFKSALLSILLCSFTPLVVQADNENVLVLQSDFGMRDGAVAAMKGVATGVERELPIFDLSHEIEPFNIWEAAYRLKQTAAYWPKGTVFVSVVDPGVGTPRKSIVLHTKSDHYFVTPNNGTLTWIAEDLGVDAMREIDETKNRLAGSEKSHTFHGRDVFAYTGARLASGVITFDQVGPLLPTDTLIRINYEKARLENKALVGSIPTLDIRYGNIWTNISDKLLTEANISPGDRVHVTINHAGTVYQGEMPYAHAFGEVAKGEPLMYLNSLLNVSFALNMSSFAETHHIKSGEDWSVKIEKVTAQ